MLKVLSVVRCLFFIAQMGLGVLSLGLFGLMGADATPEEGNSLVMGVLIIMVSALFQAVPYRYLRPSNLLILIYYAACVIVPFGLILISAVLLGLEIGFTGHFKVLLNHIVDMISMMLMIIPAIISFTAYLLISSKTSSR